MTMTFNVNENDHDARVITYVITIVTMSCSVFIVLNTIGILKMTREMFHCIND